MIKPTVGRVVWFYEYVAGAGHRNRPLAAIVSLVHSDIMVNLMVISADGVPRSETSVPLVQEGHEVPQGVYCSWMPYQLGQAAKTEELQKKLEGK